MSLAISMPRGFLWALPPRRKLLLAVGLVAATVPGLLVVATFVHLEVPEPTGAHAVGRERMTWIDHSRAESHTADPSDVRHVPVQIWYPAVPDTGTPGPYVPDLGVLESSLLESGELGAAEVWGLQWVRHHAFDLAEVAPSAEPFPVVIMSPGNATNVAFYASLAEELASRGYVVVGIDHPYQVAAVRLPDGSVATYDASWDTSSTGAEGGVERKVTERVADISYVLDGLASEPSAVRGRVDFDKVAVVGHSNGGLTAMEMCRRSNAVEACVNLDGQAAGGPLSTDVTGVAPEQPCSSPRRHRFIRRSIAGSKLRGKARTAWWYPTPRTGTSRMGRCSLRPSIPLCGQRTALSKLCAASSRHFSTRNWTELRLKLSARSG